MYVHIQATPWFATQNADENAVAPPQQSPEEIRALESEAVFTIQQVAATAFMLYLCKKQPSPPITRDERGQADLAPKRPAPFAIDMVGKIF